LALQRGRLARLVRPVEVVEERAAQDRLGRLARPGLALRVRPGLLDRRERAVQDQLDRRV
jgi:hypothetical protein